MREWTTSHRPTPVIESGFDVSCSRAAETTEEEHEIHSDREESFTIELLIGADSVQVAGSVHERAGAWAESGIGERGDALGEEGPLGGDDGASLLVHRQGRDGVIDDADSGLVDQPGWSPVLITDE